MNSDAIISTLTSLLIFIGIQIPTEETKSKPMTPCEHEYNDMRMQCIYMVTKFPMLVEDCREKMKRQAEICNG